MVPKTISTRKYSEPKIFKVCSLRPNEGYTALFVIPMFLMLCRDIPLGLPLQTIFVYLLVKFLFAVSLVKSLVWIVFDHICAEILIIDNGQILASNHSHTLFFSAQTENFVMFDFPEGNDTLQTKLDKIMFENTVYSLIGIVGNNGKIIKSFRVNRDDMQDYINGGTVDNETVKYIANSSQSTDDEQ